ncbi:hypothetical protein H4W30_004714 [Amycolatopsis roodepoortensis]|uniref:Uncharacterized protein n=1 Tax=Amycolatopsis roodepoortensis TaxID=700274 RepID=A0ABR9LAD8_9PSEU|nr:hypothetical protein [Amycolatopsis roodepoortensis]
MDAAVSSGLPPRLGSEGLCTRLPGHGPVAFALYRLDVDEHGRRQSEGVCDLTDLSALDALLTLPEGAAVARQAVSARVQRIVERLPQAIVSRDSQHLCRLARTPVTVDCVSVTVQRSWSAALHRVLEFSQYAERVLVCRSSPDTEQVLEASYWGVGITVPTNAGWDWLIEPAAFVVKHHSAARWEFAEQIYGLHLSQPNEPASLSSAASPSGSRLPAA